MTKHTESERKTQKLSGYQPIEIKDGEDLEIKDGTRDDRTEVKDDQDLEVKDGDLGRQPGNGGNFVPPLWGIGRGRHRR